MSSLSCNSFESPTSRLRHGTGLSRWLFPPQHPNLLSICILYTRHPNCTQGGIPPDSPSNSPCIERVLRRGPFYTLIDPHSLSFLLKPMAACLILRCLMRKLSHPQTCIASCVASLPACQQTVLGFVEVCAEYPFHLLYWGQAACAISFPFPPTAAFFKESTVFC